MERLSWLIFILAVFQLSSLCLHLSQKYIFPQNKCPLLYAQIRPTCQLLLILSNIFNPVFISYYVKFCTESWFYIVISGLGVNLNNQAPTTCINEMIVQLSSTTNEKLAPLSCEKLLSITFTQLEGLLNAVQMGHVRQVLDLYYSYWLHRSVKTISMELISVNCVTEDHVSVSVLVLKTEV